ncbi:MAG: ferritin-like protein [Acidimicrobiia bacterium]|nr:ferritin-like protein [Acidimicrobiia bacterium]
MTTGPALRTETREELVSLLYQAAELEHGLCCSYLFASFSCKQEEDEGLSTDQVGAVTRWRKAVKQVAEEEMLHLALVSNLLAAVGAAPHLRRPDFPQASPYYPAGITIDLHRLDDVSLTRFVYLERPEDVEVEDAIAFDAQVDLEPEVPVAAPGALQAPDDGGEEVPDASSFATVGHLYQAIEDGFEHLVEQRGERNVFIGAPGAQATADYFHFPELVAVTDLSSARRALGVLVMQGEGVRGDWTEAHYGTFLGIRDELRAAVAADPDFDPARAVMANPLTGTLPGVDGVRVVDDPMTVGVMDLFDNAYELMTAMLLRFFAQTDESEQELQVLVQTAVAVMADVIDPLGKLLTAMPAGPSHPGFTAGPSFAFHRSVTLVPHRRAAWLIFHERLVELAGYAESLTDQGAPGAVGEVCKALVDAGAQLKPHLDRPPLLQA